MTTVEQIAQVERGTPFETFPRLASYLGVSEARLRETLGFAAVTLQRRKVVGRFTLEESNRLYWLTSLMGTAELVLGDPLPGSTWANRSTGGGSSSPENSRMPRACYKPRPERRP